MHEGTTWVFVKDAQTEAVFQHFISIWLHMFYRLYHVDNTTLVNSFLYVF